MYNLFSLARLAFIKTLKALGAGGNLYTFNTTVNPDSQVWSFTQGTATSDGSKWSIPAGTPTTMQTFSGSNVPNSIVVPVVGQFQRDIVITADIQFPSTTLSSCGIWVRGRNGSNVLTGNNAMLLTLSHFQPNYRAIFQGAVSTNVNTGIGGGTRITVKIVVKPNGRCELYVNDVLKNSANGVYSVGEKLEIGFNRYTESVAYIYSGSIAY